MMIRIYGDIYIYDGISPLLKDYEQLVIAFWMMFKPINPTFKALHDLVLAGPFSLVSKSVQKHVCVFLFFIFFGLDYPKNSNKSPKFRCFLTSFPFLVPFLPPGMPFSSSLRWKILHSYQVQFSSVAQSCLTLCDPMNCSMPGLHVHHQLLEFTQTHVHWVGDAIQPSHPLLSPSPPAPNPSQHQSLFQWVNSSYEVAKEMEFQL